MAYRRGRKSRKRFVRKRKRGYRSSSYMMSRGGLRL